MTFQVCLHSDPPKPSQLVLSGALKEGSKVITLSFPQAQRVELGIDALQPNQQRPSSGKSNLNILFFLLVKIAADVILLVCLT